MSNTTGDIVKTIAWTVVLIACVVAVLLSASRPAADLLGLSTPYLAALWLLAVGARFAQRRVSIVLVAVVASLLLLIQCAIFGAVILLSRYNFEARTQAQVLLGAVVVTGLAAAAWFVRSKRSRLRSAS
ncbi:MAG: hypothetical protein JNL30_13905 [Rubrivivax sp.]|nr:hypothetical protein [Rubrivivax sp.]